MGKLTDKDDKKAYDRAKEIAAVSEFSPEYYSYLDAFASLLCDKKSYIRTRTFILCCSQARWDDAGNIRKILPSMLRLLHDSKPAVVRQSLQAIKEVVVFRPELSPAIIESVEQIDLTQYRESMASLIRADIQSIMELVES